MKRLALILLLAACTTPRAGVNVGVTPAGTVVTPSVATTMGGLRLGVSPNGGRIGTRLGPVNLGVGF